MAQNKIKPKFKTKWENIKDIDTSNDLFIREHPGNPLKIVDIEGQQTLMLLNKNKLEFLHPYNFEALQKPLTLHTNNDSIVTRFIQINNQWNLIQMEYHENSTEGRFRGYTCKMVCYNLVTREKKQIDTYTDKIESFALGQIDGNAYLFVSCKNNSGHVIYKHNLENSEVEVHFETDINDHGKLYFINGNNPVVIISDHRGYKLYSAITGKQIGGDIDLNEILTNFPHIVETSDGKNVLAVCDGTNKINIYNLSTGNIEYELVPNIAADEKIKISKTYKSKLILSWSLKKEFSKNDVLVYDLNEQNKIAHLLIDPFGKPLGKGYLTTKAFDYNNESTILLSGTDKNNKIGDGYFASLNTYTQIVGLTPSYCSEFLPYTDENGRELFIIGYEDADDNYKPYTVLYNPAGKVRNEDDYSYNYHAVNTIIDGTAVVITVSADKCFNIFDIETGDNIERVKIDNSEQIKQLLVSEVKGQKALLAMFDSEIKAYTLPHMKAMDISFPINYAMNMDIANIDGKKLLMVVNDKFMAWDLETAQPVPNPINAAFGIEEENQETYCVAGDTYCIHTINLDGTDNVFIGNVSDGAFYWNPEKPKELKPLLIDGTMWNVDPDDPDYFIHSAFGAMVDGKNILVAGAYQRAVVIFDIETGKRQGRIMRAGQNTTERNYIYKIRYNDTELLVTNDDYNIKIWTLTDNKKLKEYNFKSKVTSVSVSDNKIIVFHGEDITAIEII